jgi:hypothetical protein
MAGESVRTRSTLDLTELRIGNFKAFAETQRVPICPLTLIFGPNSSGKSSILQALALLSEAERSRNFDVQQTEIGGLSIDLGGFDQFVHGHDPDSVLTLGATFTVRQADLPPRAIGLDLAVARPPAAARPRGTSHARRPPELQAVELLVAGESVLKLGYGGTPTSLNPSRALLQQLAVHALALELEARRRDEPPGGLEHPRPSPLQGDPRATELLQMLEVGKVDKLFDELPRTRLWNHLEEDVRELGPRLKRSTYNEYASRYHDHQGISRLLPPRVRRTRVEGAGQSHAQELLNRWLEEANRFFRRVFFDAIGYLGPLRVYPPRELVTPGVDPTWEGAGGQAWQSLATDPAARKAVNRWLTGPTRLNTSYEVLVEEQYTTDQLLAAIDYERAAKGTARRRRTSLLRHLSGKGTRRVRLRDLRSNTVVSHRDVGIGISQLLPVLAAAATARDRVIAIEQPELHLHPALQAELGDLFIEAALGGRGNCFLLETHSEHLILRILRRIRETTAGRLPEGALPIRADDVSVLWLDRQPNGSQVKRIPVTSDGDFEEAWPAGFFDERAKELFE